MSIRIDDNSIITKKYSRAIVVISKDTVPNDILKPNITTVDDVELLYRQIRSMTSMGSNDTQFISITFYLGN